MATYRSDAAVQASWREWAGLAALVLPGIIVSMDMSVLFLALPFLSADLTPSAAQLLWITDIYGFLLAGLLITMGMLGDRLGRRRLLLIGAGCFLVASVIAAYSPSAELLIAARALLGAAAATLAPSTLALIRNMFHEDRQRQVAIGIWSAGFVSGALLGPIVGGSLLQTFWWGSVFLINVPAMALLLVLGRFLLPEHRDPNPGRLDLLSVLLSIAAVLLVIYGVKHSAGHGFGWLAALVIVAGFALGAVFLGRQRQLTNPLIEIRLFRSRTFSAAIVAGTLALFAMVGFAMFSALYLQLVLGMQPMEAALWMLVPFGAMIVGTSVAGPLAQVMARGHVFCEAAALSAIGCFVLTRLPAQDGLVTLLLGQALVACGVGVSMTLATDTVVAAAPPKRAGAASALSETGTEFGSALGIAVLGSIGTAVYGSELLRLAPSELPSVARDAAVKGISSAVNIAEGLPGQLGSALVDVAKVAFTEGMRVSAIACGIVMVCVAIGVPLFTRGDRTTAAVETS